METLHCPPDLQIRRSFQSIQLPAHLYRSSTREIVERVVQRQLYYYLSSNHLFSPTQHGFRPRHSTETALVSVADRILTASDQGEISLLCLIDPSKCFDIIDHSIILCKLSQYGVDTSWFAPYLSGHTQKVNFTDKACKKHLKVSTKHYRSFPGLLFRTSPLLPFLQRS